MWLAVRVIFAVAVVCAAASLWAAPAGASHVQCGDVITTNTTLHGDVLCPDAFQNFGLAIGADNVVLKMRGYAIRAGSGGGIVGIASFSPDADGLQGVMIKRGTIDGFLGGVDLAQADGTTLLKLDITTFDNQEFASDFGIDVTGDRNSILLNTISLTGGENGGGAPGISLTGDDSYAWANVVTGNVATGGFRNGIVLEGDRPRAVLNRVTGCASPTTGGTGLHVFGYTTSAIVNRNVVSGCNDTIVVRSLNPDVGGARVALNEGIGGWYGLYVDDGFATVNRNVARNAKRDGIVLSSPGTYVRNNGAFDNAEVGIRGVAGTVDGGGNVASGNGTTPQCVNVECSEPPPPS